MNKPLLASAVLVMALLNWPAVAFIVSPTPPDAAEGLQCSQLSMSSCSYLPGCSPDNWGLRCVGRPAGIPRFLSEFSETMPGRLPQDLANELGLEWIATRHQTPGPDALAARKEYEKNLKRYDIPNDIKAYPSIDFLQFSIKYVLNLAKKLDVPVKQILRLQPDYLMLAATNEDLPVHFSMDWLLQGNNSRILSYSQHALDTYKNAGITPEQLIEPHVTEDVRSQSKEIVACMTTQGLSFDWLARLGYASLHIVLSDCARWKQIKDFYSVDDNALPTTYEGIYFLTEHPKMASLKDLMSTLGLPLLYLADHKVARADVADIQKTMAQFQLSAKEAVLINPEWNTFSLAQIQAWSRQTGLSKTEIMSVKPKHFEIPKETSLWENIVAKLKTWANIPNTISYRQVPILAFYLKSHIPLEVIARDDLLTMEHPKAFFELVELWQKATNEPMSEYTALKFKNMSNHPQDVQEFLKNVKIADGLITIQQMLYSQNSEALIFKNAILMGDEKRLKGLPFFAKVAGEFIPDTGFTFQFAQSLGYDDIAQLLKAYVPNTVRIDGKTLAITECALPKSPFELSSEKWYARCNPFEPTSLRYQNQVGHFIEKQGLYWKHSDMGHIGLAPEVDVNGALIAYKTHAYSEMVEFNGKNATQPLPFRSEDGLADKVNGINFTLLLAPKPDFDLQVFRGQSCEIDRIEKPFRLWSTSASAAFSYNWSQLQGENGCLLDVKIPKGFPVFFLNISSMANARESEFLLPSYALNTQGKLVAVRYEIVEGKTKRDFVSTDYDAANEIEYQYHFTQQSYTVQPAGDLMTFANSNIEDFADYERRYQELVCAPENIDDPHFEYLQAMCAAVKH